MNLMAAPTCLYTDPKKEGDGPRLYLSSNQGWTEDPQRAIEFFSLSTAPRVHQVPIGYQPSQTILAEVIKVHPAVRKMREMVPKLRELFPAAIVMSLPPKTNIQLPWFIDVVMPADKRSFTVEYRYQHHQYHLEPFGQIGVKTTSNRFLTSDDEMLLQAITVSEPIACRCECHGPVDGFFHSWSGDCCQETSIPRTNADRLARV